MKILHTSDWHLGHTLYNYDRTKEQKDMIIQMTDIIRREKPDVFLLCGDVYHTSQPSAAIQRLFTNSLVEMHNANPDMTIIITSGNHDSASKHEIFSTPWKALNVHTIGVINRENIDEHIIFIPGKGYVIAVPYSHERNIPEGFFQRQLDSVREKNTDNLPVVMTAHTTVRGCDFTGHEHGTEYTVGGIDSLDLEQLGEGYDYLALGHIHHEQFVHTGRHNVRYCGSPLAVSFDEQYPHSVSMIELSRHGDTPQCSKIEINNKMPLVTLPSKGMATWEEAKDLLSHFPDDIPAYIRLNVEIDEFLPAEANADANALTNGKACRFCLINAKRKKRDFNESRTLTIQEFQSERPVDIARRYAEDMNMTFDEEMEQLFNETIRIMNDESDND